MQGKVHVLGVEYSIVEREVEEDARLIGANGYVDSSVKRIVVCKEKRDEYTLEDMNWFTKKVIRHEIIHAFLCESGLASNSLVLEEGWAKNEEMVDWFALQSPKIFEAFKEADCM